MESSINSAVANAGPVAEPIRLVRHSPAQRNNGGNLAELLAPAGDWECVKAAVENGADAVYFGLDRFNARMRAQNFTEADLPELMEFLHRRGVKGYVTFNTLVFANEMADAEQFLRALIAAGVDAAIVQDVGNLPLDPDAFARFSHSRLHPDDRHQRGGSGICPRTGLQPRRAGARMFGPGNRKDQRRPGRPRSRWRCLCMARSASPIPANA